MIAVRGAVSKEVGGANIGGQPIPLLRVVVRVGFGSAFNFLIEGVGRAVLVAHRTFEPAGGRGGNVEHCR